MAKCRMAGGTQIEALAGLLCASRRLLVITGAGCSTESGIPDYRDRLGAWKRKPPMSYQEFIGSVAAQRRYWARASIGWRRMRSVQPGRSHRALARLEQSGRVAHLITQNVDGLHQRAGTRQVIDLHGRIDAVRCLQCGTGFPRAQIHAQLEGLNPAWTEFDALLNPDGDVQLDDLSCDDFQLIGCARCGGPLKPAVVFFGESVPVATVVSAWAAVDAADAVLVVGSSLMVYSGYRFVRSACERGLPVAIVNLGATRADAQVSLKVEGSCGEVLERLEAALSNDSGARASHRR